MIIQSHKENVNRGTELKKAYFSAAGIKSSNRFVRFRSAAMLFFAALIWGSAFVAQDSAGEKLDNSVFTITFSRFLIGAAVLFPFWLVYRKRSNGAKTKAEIKRSMLYGTYCGLALFAPCALQQLGINSGASSAKAGFITVMYVVLVPICGLFMKKDYPPFAGSP